MKANEKTARIKKKMQARQDKEDVIAINATSFGLGSHEISVVNYELDASPHRQIRPQRTTPTSRARRVV